MAEFCHRCHAELPQYTESSKSRSGLEPDALLFCPHCSAPQIRLPEHMRPLAPAPVAPSTTGSLPPPDPRDIDWPIALRAAGAVALIGAVLNGVGVFLPFLAFVGALWVVACAGLTVSQYRRRVPAAVLGSRAGFRLGITAGVLMFAALGPTLAVEGTVERFATHRMDTFDTENARETKDLFARYQAWMKTQGQSDEAQKEDADRMNSTTMRSPEWRAGSMLFGYAMEGGLLVLLAGALGATAGALGSRRRLTPGR